MRFDARLQQRLEQRMILAPRMIQAMEILQLPLMALQERIDQELIANPVLEIRGEGEEPPPETDEAEESPTAPLAEPERDLVVREDNKPEEFERLSNLVDRWENYFEEDADSFRRSRPAAGDSDPKAEAMQNAPAAGVTLQEHMLGLWDAEGLDERATALGQLIIRNLDDSGYLRVPLEELAAEAEPPASLEEMAEVLEEVQRTGPLGVGARNLEECLLLQLQGPPGQDAKRLPDDSLEVRIIRHHLHDVEANRYPQMVEELHATLEEVKEVVDRIRRLNPRPGSVISPRSTPTIIPDVKIDRDEETDQFRVTVLSGGTPELYISGAYRRLVKQEDLDTKTRKFVAGNIRSAQWLMEAIEQRRDTLRRVTEAILKFQRPFFEEGPATPAAEDAAGGRRSAPARRHRQPRGLRQVRRHPVGHLAAARLLHRRHPGYRRRGRRQLGPGPGPPQGPRRRRGQDGPALRRGPRRTPAGRRHRQTRPPHRGQVPRGTWHSVLVAVGNNSRNCGLRIEECGLAPVCRFEGVMPLVPPPVLFIAVQSAIRIPQSAFVRIISCMDSLMASLGRIRRRLLLVCAVEAGLMGALAAAPPAALFTLIRIFMPQHVPQTSAHPALPLVLLPCGFLVGMVWQLVHGVTLHEAAMAADRAAGLQERLTTAAEVLSPRAGAAMRAGLLDDRLLEQARAAAAAIDPRQLALAQHDAAYRQDGGGGGAGASGRGARAAGGWSGGAQAGGGKGRRCAATGVGQGHAGAGDPRRRREGH